MEGTAAFLICDVVSNTPIDYSFKFNDKIISKTGNCSDGRVGPFQFVSPSNTVIICKLNFKVDQGKYTCTAKNEIGSTSKDMQFFAAGESKQNI